MRRGCIAIGKLECHGCQRSLAYGEHYLVTDEEENEEKRFCMDCCVSRGYISYRMKKEQQIITFLSGE